MTKAYNIMGGSLSAVALKQLLQASYVYNKDKPTNVRQWIPDTSLSGERVQVYTHRRGKRVVVVHRGSQDINDWITNYQMATGYTGGPRFAYSLKIQKLAESKYGKENITTIGHSLGAKLAETSGKDSHEVIAYNGPTTQFDLFQKQGDNVTKIRTSGDPVSSLAPVRFHKPIDRNITVPTDSWNPLTQHSMEPLDGLQGRVGKFSR